MSSNETPKINYTIIEVVIYHLKVHDTQEHKTEDPQKQGNIDKLL